MGEHGEYEDRPASQINALCVVCDGDGWRLVARAGVFEVGAMGEVSAGSRLVTVGKQEPCPVCQQSAADVPAGRVNMATGPGSGHLRRVDRVPFPNDGWG